MKLTAKSGFVVLAIAANLYSCSPAEKKPELKPADPVKLEDFFRDPDKGQFRISPNGEMIMFMAPHKGRKNVFVQMLSDTTAKPITEETERSIYDAFWESDNRIIFVKDSGGDENMHILSVKPDGTDLKDH